MLFFGVGSIVGFFTFSHIVGWLLKHHKNKTLSLLTGFIVGSLLIVWPWKEINKSIIIGETQKILSYNWYYPTEMNSETLIAIGLIITGILVVYILDNITQKGKK